MNFQWFKDNLWQILINIIGGACTAALAALYIQIRSKLRQRHFKHIFGSDIESFREFHLVYAELGLPNLYDQNRNRISHPYIKPIPVPGRRENAFSIERPISSCEVRAANYLAFVVGKEIRKSPNLTSDTSLIDKLNLSFIAFGGPSSNHKTNDLLINEANKLISFHDYNFVSVYSNQPVIMRENEFDYGLILKINPHQFPNRVWITCAGLGEWGTSGAVWYLANKWKDIYRYAKNKPFAIIVKVRPKQDESAVPVFMAKTQKEIEDKISKNIKLSDSEGLSSSSAIPGSGDYRTD
jgi:hypothetical protein